APRDLWLPARGPGALHRRAALAAGAARTPGATARPGTGHVHLGGGHRHRADLGGQPRRSGARPRPCERTSMTTGRIAFQGELGANSHEACQAAFPDLEPAPHATFEEAFEAVRSGDCRLGMIPVENSIAGRVADV